MSFDFNAVIGDMLAAMKESVDTDWDDVQGYAKQVIENERETLLELADQRLAGLLTDEELKSELEDEKATVAAQLKAVQVMSKAMAQRAANAAMDVLFNAVRAAL